MHIKPSYFFTNAHLSITHLFAIYNSLIINALQSLCESAVFTSLKRRFDDLISAE